MQNKVKKLIIYLAVAFTALLGAYAYMEKLPTLNTRHTPLTSLSALIDYSQQQSGQFFPIVLHGNILLLK